jgi:anti-anti-sigma regulatory factor
MTGGNATSNRVDRRPGLAVLYTDGYVNNEAGERLSRDCYTLMEEGFKRILLNLAGTKIVNEIGISILVEIIEKGGEQSVTLAFCDLAPVIKKTFEIMGLTNYAKVFPDESSAVADMRA